MKSPAPQLKTRRRPKRLKLEDLQPVLDSWSTALKRNTNPEDIDWKRYALNIYPLITRTTWEKYAVDVPYNGTPLGETRDTFADASKRRRAESLLASTIYFSYASAGTEGGSCKDLLRDGSIWYIDFLEHKLKQKMPELDFDRSFFSFCLYRYYSRHLTLEEALDREPMLLPDGELDSAGNIKPIFSIEATGEEVGARLKLARRAKGWTQLELAQAMGLTTKRTVQNLETADRSPSIDTVRAAMEALEITEL